MRITVKARPLANEDKVEKKEDGNFIVSVTEPPIGGRANAAIISLLAEHFNVPKSNVQIISGRTSRQKIVEIKE